MTAWWRLLFVLLAGPLPAIWPGASEAADTAPCRAVMFAEASFTVCTFDLRQTELRLHWKDANGEAYGSLGALVGAEQASNPPLSFAM
ncbi:hypothetical protein, partial [Enterococcus faecium]|uniref:hypothetical protein n=1 Tax=Enterococcus faecium TaxID=1352 RepID=UPI003F4367FA